MLLEEVIYTYWRFLCLFSIYLVVDRDAAGSTEALLLIVKGFYADGVAIPSCNISQLCISFIFQHMLISSIQRIHQIISFQYLLLLSLFLLLITGLILIFQIVLFSLDRRLKLYALLIFAFFYVT